MDELAKKPNRSAEVTIETIEGGDVSDYAELEVKPKHHREVTARRLAMMLVAMLGGSVFIHYLALFLLVVYDKNDVADKLSHFFNAWLPVISGLVGSATTYYFTKEKA